MDESYPRGGTQKDTMPDHDSERIAESVEYFFNQAREQLDALQRHAVETSKPDGEVVGDFIADANLNGSSHEIIEADRVGDVMLAGDNLSMEIGRELGASAKLHPKEFVTALAQIAGPSEEIEKKIIGKIDMAEHLNDSPDLEIARLSQDPENKLAASERNATVTLEAIWANSTLHHGTKSSVLDSILQNGLVANGDKAAQYGHKEVFFGPSLREMPSDSTNNERLQNLGYYGHNSSDIYLHFVRDETSYRAGEEKISYSDVVLSDGLPATELSAVMLNVKNLDILEKTYQSVHEAGFFVPIFDNDGKQIYSKEHFDENVVPPEIQKIRDWRAQNEKFQREREAKEKARIAQAATEKGMTVEEYQRWRVAQIRDEDIIV